MGRLKDSTENKAMGTHFTWEHRLQLQYFHEGTGKFPKIRNRRILAEKLGKSTRTIQRELQRGMVMHETSNIPFHKMWSTTPNTHSWQSVAMILRKVRS